MDVVAALTEIQLRPVLRQRPIHVVTNQSCQGALVRVLLLQSAGFRLHGSRQMQRLTAPVGGHGLRPDLPYLGLCEVDKVVEALPLFIYAHRPPAAAARLIPNKVRDVGCGNKDALARISLCTAAVGRAKRVLLLGNELFDELEVRFAYGGKLAQLDEPESLDVLHGILALHCYKTLGVPTAGEFAHKGCLAQSLFANERQNGVKLDAGLKSAADSGNKGFT